jgi:hypothetical protein
MGFDAYEIKAFRSVGYAVTGPEVSLRDLYH